MKQTEYQPSAWMRATFGELAREVAYSIVSAAMSSQDAGEDAKQGSGLATNQAYGATVWLAFAQDVANELESRGLPTVRPKGASYRVAVVEGTALLAVKLPASSNGVDHLRIESAVRQRVLLGSGFGSPTSTTLDFGPEFDFIDQRGEPLRERDLEHVEDAVLVVAEGTVTGGVSHIHIGEVSLNDGGWVTWLHREELPIGLIADAGSEAGLVVVEPAQTRSFASAEIPQAAIGLAAEAEGTAAMSEAAPQHAEKREGSSES